MKRRVADFLIVFLRLIGSVQWKYSVINWGYGQQAQHAWEQP